MIISPLPLLIVIGALVALGVTGNLFSPSPIVIGVQIAAIAFNIWARSAFKRGTFRATAGPTADSLITSGPYRFVRHPMYSAALVFIWTGIVSHPSALTCVIGMAVTAVCIARVMVEDRLLRAKYPEYSAYSRSTKALVPFVY